MKKVNFNQLKNIKTPDEWVEKAVNIPEKKNNPLSFSQGTYKAAFALSLLICCAVVAVLAASFGGNDITKGKITLRENFTKSTAVTDSADKNNPISDNTEKATDKSGNILYALPSDNSSDYQSQGSNDSRVQSTTEPTADQSDGEQSEPTDDEPNTFDSDFEPEAGRYDVYSAGNVIEDDTEPETVPTVNPKSPSGEVGGSGENGGDAANPNHIDSIEVFSGSIVLKCTDFDYLDSDGGIYFQVGTKFSDAHSESGACAVTRYNNCVVAEFALEAPLPQGIYTVVFYDINGNEVSADVTLCSNDILIVY